MKKLLLIGSLIFSASFSASAQDIPDFPDFCAITCFAEDATGMSYPGVDMDFSRAGNATCSEDLAFERAMELCEARAEKPESCLRVADSCE